MANPKPKPKTFIAKTVIGKSLKTADDQFEKDYPGIASSSVYKNTKNTIKNVATKLGFKKGGTVKKAPKGYHIMPDGKVMKNSAHKKKK